MTSEQKDATKKKSGNPFKDDEVKKEELSEADLKIKADVELCVQRLTDASSGVVANALESLASMLRVATGAVTGIPKPLKYLRPQAPLLKAAVDAPVNATHEANRRKLCDVIAVVSMTLEQPEGATECLDWKIRGTGAQDLASWSHEFVRHVSGEVAERWNVRQDNGESIDNLVPFVKEIVSFEMAHQGEPHACDLLIEIDETDKLVECTDDSNYAKVCQYLLSVAGYLPYPEDDNLYRLAGRLYEKFGVYVDAMRLALKVGDSDLVLRLLNECPNPSAKAQMALLCGQHRFFVQTGDEELDGMIGNNHRNALYTFTARDMDSMAPKTTEDIVKSHLIDQRTNLGSNSVPSYMKNLANVFVSAFGNAGFSTDKMTTEKDDSSWLHGQKDDRVISAVASLGVVHLWNHEEGLNVIDKYFSSDAAHIKPGACLGVGLMFSGTRNMFEPAFSMLSENLPSSVDKNVRLTSILGLGIAYAGTRYEDACESLTGIVADSTEDVEVQAFASLALGMIFVSACHESSETITMCLMEKTPEQLQHPAIRYMIVGLAMYFLGKQEAAEAIIEMSMSFPEKIQKYSELVFTTVAYAGSGNVMKVQRFQSIISAAAEQAKKKEEEDKSAKSESGNKELTDEEKAKKDKEEAEAPLDESAIAVMGIGLIAMGEEIGCEMLRRTLDNVLQFGAAKSRRAIPLAHAISSVSNPQIPVLEALSKLSHDQDKPTAQAAILAIGIVAGGTNNARAATMLRSLASFYAKDSECLFLTHVSLGLVFLGKGHITMSPLHSDRFLASPVAMASLLTIMHTMLDAKGTLFGSYHYILYALVPSMSPRMTVTVDAALKPVQTQVRVGTAVDTVAMAGKPKTITGFQTHNTPVLLQFDDRVEVPKGGKHRAVCNVVEGVVIVEEVNEGEN